MYIPAFFSTAANGCPSGYNSYELQHYTITNLNSGARGRIVTNYNKYTNEVTGSNFIGLGDVSSFELGNGGSTGIDALRRPYPSLGAPEHPNFGTGNQDINPEYYVTGSNGQPITYCYDCTRKWRWTFGSKAGLPAPWPLLTTPLSIRVLTNSNGSITNTADYTITTLNFDYTQTGSVEGYGPLWQLDANNASYYYIISREDITLSTYSIIQNCSSSVTATALFSGSYYPSTGFTFLSNTSGVSGSCWNVIGTGSFEAFPTYSNVVTQSSYTNCTDCEIARIGSGSISWSYNTNTSNALFTIYDNATIITTLSGSGTGNTNNIVPGNYVTASLTPVNYPTGGVFVMNISANGNQVTQSVVSYANTTITSSFLVTKGSATSITASVSYLAVAVTSSLVALYDLQYNSYNGSGSTVYDISGNGNNATIVYPTSWSFATPDYLGVQPSLILKNTYYEVGGYPIGTYYNGVRLNNTITSTSNFTLVLSWYGQNANYNSGVIVAPLFTDPDQDPGNNSFGFAMGNADLGNAVGIGTNGLLISNPVGKVSGSASESDWHISQVSWNDGTNIISYCLDGITGSFSGSAGSGNPQFEIFPSTLTSGVSVGSGSAWQVAAVYTSSLSTSEMLSNYNVLKNRYGL